MKSSYYKGAAILCAFFFLVLAVPIALNPHFPLLVIAGETSIGTWLSGALLMMCATSSLIIGMRKGWLPWFFITVFFILLALDERFMFHEQLKEKIIFSLPSAQVSFLIYELPVLAGALVGALFAYILWDRLYESRALIVFATVLGIASVGIDVLGAGVMWEECSKLLAELLITFALLKKVAQYLE
jgi:hypothetical protein